MKNYANSSKQMDEIMGTNISWGNRFQISAEICQMTGNIFFFLKVEHEFTSRRKFISTWIGARTYLVSMLESRPNTIGRGPAQVGATAATALGFTKPFFAARSTMDAAWPPPNITKSFSGLKPMLVN